MAGAPLSIADCGSVGPPTRGKEELNGQRRIRTADTVIFSHVLYQLSYLPDRKPSAQQ